MPQIGWLEILTVVIIAILVLGPKEFPIALKKIGSFFGKLKNTISSFQREVTSVTDDIDIEKNTSLEALQKQMIAPINHLRDYLFDPHLSLAYGDADEMRYLIKGIHLERFISFNSVAIVFVPDNVDEWKIINKFEFNFDL